MGVVKMTDNIRMRAQLKGEITEVKILMTHPMETGRRKNDFGDVIPANFIQTVTATLNGKILLEAHWGTGISKNPRAPSLAQGSYIVYIYKVVSSCDNII
jgi:sulfur-oxidizing protein SoxZ